MADVLNLFDWAALNYDWFVGKSEAKSDCGYNTMPERVAKVGVRALYAGRAECIPGFFNKSIIFLVPVVPLIVIRWIHGWRKTVVN